MTPSPTERLANIIRIAIDHFDLPQPRTPYIHPDHKSEVIVTTEEGTFKVIVVHADYLGE